MINNYVQIADLFRELSQIINDDLNLFVIGGSVLLEQGLKAATKDIDIVVNSRKEFSLLEKALERLNFVQETPGKEYKNMNLNQIFQRSDFRIDL